ncbi:hypothetical protein TREMEDRAFT_21899, partial [Tremella mesenterica DSM 1558]|uniref:uncharacterized protein n=1 Tax=Tremella mesenterica (strain ATCC 24925 / CBS 8224 / DSM 1558 / NBRC 9311 / NRRL Y-6157 / RJB 2259-6 / UBC 559-6) TaxID=578456 RepID=UPI0003F49CC9
EVIRLDNDEFLCPGLIDTHTHAPQFPNNGLGGSLQLLEWLDKLTFPEEEKYEDLDYAKRVYERVVERTLRSGTTTSCYYATIHVEASVLLARICERRGQRAFIGKCNMDRNSPPTYIEPSTSSSLQSTLDFISHFPSPSSPTSLVRPILTPRFAISCTSPLLHGLSSISNSYSPPLPIQTHLSENPSEVELAKKLYNSSTYTEIYHSHGLLRKGTILAHCVHLEPSERNLIAECGAGVSHCPTSNINLLSGSCRVVELLDQGIPVGLGTDCSGGYSTGVLNTLRDASTVSRCLAFGEKGRRWLSVEELFAMATLGGAEVCGLDDRICNFQVGKEFDALRIFSGIHGDAKGWMKEWEEKEKEKLKKRFEKWLWTGDDRDIAGVWVRGRKV